MKNMSFKGTVHPEIKSKGTFPLTCKSLLSDMMELNGTFSSWSDPVTQEDPQTSCGAVSCGTCFLSESFGEAFICSLMGGELTKLADVSVRTRSTSIIHPRTPLYTGSSFDNFGSFRPSAGNGLRRNPSALYRDSAAIWS